MQHFDAPARSRVDTCTSSKPGTIDNKVVASTHESLIVTNTKEFQNVLVPDEP